MRVKTYYFLLLLAVALLLGHQLVPHCHCAESEYTAVSSERHNDDLLSKIFGADIGANHLENYTAGKTAKHLINPVIIFDLFQLSLGASNALVTIGVHPDSVFSPSILRHHIASFSPRPPPVV
jgi:hypothetical protein